MAKTKPTSQKAPILPTRTAAHPLITKSKKSPALATPSPRSSTTKKTVTSSSKVFPKSILIPTILRTVAIVLISTGLLAFFAAPKTSDLKTSASDTRPTSQINSRPETSPAASVSAEVPSAPVPTPSSDPRVPILYYHYVEVNPNPAGDPGRDSLLVTPANFEDQMLALKFAGYATITLDDLVTGIHNPSTLPDKPVILTFDDGYADFYTNAFPLLQKFGLKSTIFVMSHGQVVPPTNNRLSSDQILELSRSPLITVGDHTIDHPDLKGRSQEFQHHQIFQSKSDLEKLIGKPVRHFAYPYGGFDQTTLPPFPQPRFPTPSST